MDYSKAALIYQLAKDYQDVAQSLKALRAGALVDAERERHRSLATSWFNRIYMLWMGRFIEKDVLLAVVQQRAAQLYCQYVVALDHAIRVKQGGETNPPGLHPIEQFWAAFAKGELQVPADPDVPITTPEPSQETAH